MQPNFFILFFIHLPNTNEESFDKVSEHYDPHRHQRNINSKGKQCFFGLLNYFNFTAHKNDSHGFIILVTWITLTL